MDYNDCVQYISSIETYDAQDRSATADVYDLGAQVEIDELDQPKAEAVVSRIEELEGTQTGGGAQGQQGGQPAGARQKAPPQRIAGQQAVNAASAGKAEHAAGDLSRLVASTGAGAEKAAENIYAIIGHAGREMSKLVGQKGKNEKLVATELSLQDQINELEKISLGLDGSAYNEEQLAIIKVEVGGLTKNRGKPPANDFQKELYALRDERLAEVAAKLGL